MPHRYSPAEIATVYRVIAERRDMRHFLPDPIDPAILARLLEAAHRRPSVAHATVAFRAHHRWPGRAPPRAQAWAFDRFELA